VKGGGPLETLARTRELLLDKSGTVTAARPEVVAVETLVAAPPDALVCCAASLEQVSGHPYALAILAGAQSRSLTLSFPSEVTEHMGTGIRGFVDCRRIAVGQPTSVAPGCARTRELRLYPDLFVPKHRSEFCSVPLSTMISVLG
jgi:cation transport ATPase